MLQYRNKSASAALRAEQAAALRRLTTEFGIPLIVNDDAELALAVAADGVHLGGEDGAIGAARALLGHDRIIGVSCYNRLPSAIDAARQGADYVAFGAFFRSGVKPDAVAAAPALLHEARASLPVPIVAIGGITTANGAQLIDAGADMLAVISAVFAAPDVRQAAQDFSNLFRAR